MRIDQLSLQAFGKFTDRTLDLSQGEQGLHLIYGQNEAGKSTSLRAITDWLFGFQHRATDNFIHPNANIRVGGVVRDSHGRRLGSIRRRGNANTLRDAEDRETIPDAKMAEFLGNISRENFGNMFGIDQVRLRSGGEALIQNQGNIGEALFAGASGITQLRSISDSLKSETQRLFTSRGGEINQKLQVYREKEQLLKSEFVSAGQWDKLQRQFNEAIQQRDELNKQIGDREAEINRLKRILDNLETVSRWRDLQFQWRECKDFVLLDDDFGPVTSRLKSDLLVLSSRLGTQTEDRSRIAAKIAELAEPQGREKFFARLEDLQKFGRTYSVHRHQLPMLLEEQKNIGLAIQRIYDTLEQSPGRLTLDAIQTACKRKKKVQDLIEQKQRMDLDLGQHKILIDSKTNDLESTNSELATLKVAPNLQSLRVRIKGIRAENPSSRLEDQKLQLESKRSEIAKLHHQVSPSGMSIDQLADDRIPTQFDIEQFEEDERNLRTQLRKHTDAIEGERQTLTTHETALTHLESSAAIPTLEDLIATRELRDSAWSLVKERWIQRQPSVATEEQLLKDANNMGSIADALEELIQRADCISDELRRDATKVAEKYSLQRDIAICNGRIQASRQLKEECEERLSDWKQRWEKAWTDVGITAKSLREMEAWVKHKDGLLSSNHELSKLQCSVQSLEELDESSRNDVEMLLQKSGVSLHIGGSSLQELLDIAEEFLEMQSQTEKRQNDLEKQRLSQEASIRNVQLEKDSVSNKLALWQRQWTEEMNLLLLPEEAACSDADRMLEHYDLLEAKLLRYADLSDQIQWMENENKEFLSRLESLCRDFGYFDSLSEDSLSDDGASPLDALARMGELAAQDKANSEKRSELQEQLEVLLAKIGESTRERDRILEQLEQQLAKTDKDSIEQLEQAADESKRKTRLQDDIRNLQAILIPHAPGGDIDAFVAEVQHSDRDNLQPNIDKGLREVKELKQNREEATRIFHQTGVEIERLKERDRSVQTSLECELLASEIEEQLRDLMVTRICSSVLQEGIEKFRENNQAPILKATSQYFQEMTADRFGNLRVDWVDDKPVIVAVHSDSDRTLEVDKMSDGTRDQLYLALRLASLQEWLERHPPLPFIVDDILIHFDNERAKATLKALARLSSKTQVIFFTHHKHLVDLASDSISSGQLFVHNL